MHLKDKNIETLIFQMYAFAFLLMLKFYLMSVFSSRLTKRLHDFYNYYLDNSIIKIEIYWLRELKWGEEL